MKLSFLSFSAALLALTALTSCDSLTGGGYDVKDPTRDQMLELDRQWGLPDINSKPKSRAVSSDDDNYSRPAAVQSAPVKVDAAPAEPEKAKPPVPPLPDAEKLKSLR